MPGVGRCSERQAGFAGHFSTRPRTQPTVLLAGFSLHQWSSFLCHQIWSCLNKNRPDPLSGPHGKGSLWLHWVNLQGVWIFRLVLITDTQIRLYANECHPLAVGASCVFLLVRLSVLRTCLEFFWIPSDSVKIHAYFIRLTSFKILLSLLIWSGSECLFKIHIYWQICNYYRLKTNVS